LKNISVDRCVISTGGRNLRSLTLVRDDNAFSGHCDTASPQEGEDSEGGFAAGRDVGSYTFRVREVLRQIGSPKGAGYFFGPGGQAAFYEYKKHSVREKVA